MSKRIEGNTFIKGAAILGIASLLSKMLGLGYRIPYQNITGDLGYYVYTQVYPLYGALLIFATAGFPIAISKIVSEKLAVGDSRGVQKVFRVSIATLVITGILTFLLLYSGAEWIALAMGNVKLTLPIRSVSFALLIVPPMAAIRGYFQGHQNMLPTGVSQIMEQLVRVTTIIALAYWFMTTTEDEYMAGAGAVFGAFTGACAGLITLILYWKKYQPQRLSGVEGAEFTEEPTLVLIRRILYYSIPICFGALVLPMLQLSDSFTVANLLTQTGVTADEANILKGIFDRGQPLVAFGAFFATALALSLVPSISAAQARRANQMIRHRTELALRLTLLIGLPASIGLAMVAEPVNIMLYQNDKGTDTLIVLAFTTIFSTLGITSAGILQGLGQVILPARNLFIGVFFKVGLNLLLIPKIGITGAAIATVGSYALATLFNLHAVAKYTGASFGIGSFFLKPVLAVSIMAVMVWIVDNVCMNLFFGIITNYRMYYSVVTLVSVSIGAIVYGACLLLFGTISKSEMEIIPKANKFIPILSKLHLLRD